MLQLDSSRTTGRILQNIELKIVMNPNQENGGRRIPDSQNINIIDEKHILKESKTNKYSYREFQEFIKLHNWMMCNLTPRY